MFIFGFHILSAQIYRISKSNHSCGRDFDPPSLHLTVNLFENIQICWEISAGKMFVTFFFYRTVMIHTKVILNWLEDT